MKVFKFKEGATNIEKLYHYATYKFPALKSRLEYDEWGFFIMYHKDNDTNIFYYIRATTGDLNYNVYKNNVAKIDKPIIQDFKTKVYSEENLKSIFDKVLKPLTR